MPLAKLNLARGLFGNLLCSSVSFAHKLVIKIKALNSCQILARTLNTTHPWVLRLRKTGRLVIRTRFFEQ